MKSGIYAIKNTRSGKLYIGRTIDLRKRKMTHFWMLENNRHPNIALQRAFNKGDELVFEVIEYCEDEELNEREIFWIAHYDTMNEGYNLCAGGKTTTGYKFTDEQRKKLSKANRGRKCSEESVRRRVEARRKHFESDPKFKAKMMDVWMKQMHQVHELNKGRHLSEEHKKHLSEALRGRYVSDEHKEKLRSLYSGEKSITAKLKKSDVVDIRYRFLSGERQVDICKDYCVTKQTIYDICRNRRWRSVPNDLETLEKMKEEIA